MGAALNRLREVLKASTGFRVSSSLKSCIDVINIGATTAATIIEAKRLPPMPRIKNTTCAAIAIPRWIRPKTKVSIKRSSLENSSEI